MQVEIKNVRGFVCCFFGFFLVLKRHGKFDPKLKSSNKCFLSILYIGGKHKEKYIASSLIF